MKKTSCLLLAAVSVFAFLLLSACGTENIPDDTGTAAVTEPISSETVPDTEKNENLLPIITDGKPNFCFVYQKENLPDGMTAYNYSKIANNLAITWKQKTGVTFSVYGEGKLPQEHPAVVAVGNVPGFSDNAYTGFRYRDFSITYENGTFVLAAMTADNMDVLEGRMDGMLTEKEGTFYLDITKMGDAHKERYKINSFTAGGIDLGKFSLVYDDAEKETAEEFKALLMENAGISLPSGKDLQNAKRIVFKSDSSLSGYEISHSGSEYVFRFNPGLPERLMLEYIEDAFTKLSRGSDFTLESLETVYTADWERSIITFNVLDVYVKNGTTGARDVATTEFLLNYHPDFFCLQEFDPGYRNTKNGLADKVAADYSEVAVDGVKPDDIWNPIFYLTDKYECISSGYYNLRIAAGAVESTTYYGSPDGLSSFRTLVFAVLKDKKDGSLYLIGNTHCTPNKTTHVQEAAFIYDTVCKLANDNPGCKTFVTGDLNSARTASNGAVAQLCKLGFKDTYDTAAIKNDCASYHDLGAAPNGKYQSSGIDHILTLGGIETKAYYNVSKASLWSASDHIPVVLGFN